MEEEKEDVEQVFVGQPKSKGKGLLIVIIIILVLCACLGGFLIGKVVYDKKEDKKNNNLNQEDKEKQDKQDKPVDEPVDEPVEEPVEKPTETPQPKDLGEKAFNLIPTTFDGIATLEEIFVGKKVDLTKISDKAKMSWVFYIMQKRKGYNIPYCGDKPVAVSEKDVTNNSIFENNSYITTYKNNKLDALYVATYKNNNFEVVNSNCDNRGPGPSDSELIQYDSYKEENGNLSLYVRFGYFTCNSEDWEQNGCKWTVYGGYNKVYKIGENVKYSYDMKLNSDNSALYKFTIKKVGDKLYPVTVELAETPKQSQEAPKQNLETAKKQMNEIYNKLYNGNTFGIFGLKLTEDNKLALLLDNITFSNNKLSEQTVKNEYKKMYGDTLTTNPKELNGINTCSLYKYNSSTKEYTKTEQGCDMGWGWHLYSYVYKHEVDGNNAYLYTSIAVEDGFGDTTNPAKIYTDFDEPYAEKYLFTTISTGAKTFVLNQSNYTNFAKYKLTFSFDNNEYHFKKIEKIENGKTK